MHGVIYANRWDYVEFGISQTARDPCVLSLRKAAQRKRVETGTEVQADSPPTVVLSASALPQLTQCVLLRSELSHHY